MKKKKNYITAPLGLKIKRRLFYLWLMFLEIVKKHRQLVRFGAFLFLMITQAYFFVICMVTLIIVLIPN